MTPSLEIGNGNWAVKSDSLLGYKTINGKYYPREMSVVRATTGTRVNAAGLVELVPYNLLRYSEEFDNAAWSANNATVTVNTTTAPNGTLTADTITNVSGSLIGQALTFSTGQTFTFSVYLKRISGTGIINIIDVNGNLVPVSVTNDWQRFSITSTTTSTTARAYFRVMTTGDSIAAWGAQLVEGTQPLTYLPTTDRLDIARIDYSTGSPALLVEPQRTNLLRYSEQFNDAAWSKQNTIITANSTTAPNGTLTANKLIANTTLNQHRIDQTPTSSAGVQTFSVYAKAAEYTFVSLRIGLSGSVFNLTTGAVTNTSGGCTASAQSVGNGWYRCILTSNAAAANDVCRVNITDGSTLVIDFAGNNVSGIFIWGAQLEAGSNATSYIPTVASTVTRNADVISKTGISDLIGQSEGTMFCELNLNNLLGNVNRRILCISNNNSASENIQITFTSALTNTIRAVVATGGSFPLITSSQITNLGKIKIAVAYSTTDVVLYINGVKQGTDLGSVSKPVLNSIQLGNLNNADYLNDSINSAALWKTRLTNAQLATLTTI
jgi:hypothetical protein